MIIRKVDIQDLESLLNLFIGYLEFYKKEIDREKSKKFLQDRIKKNDSVILVAQDKNNQLVGFTQLYPSFSSLSQKQNWILNDLFVAKSARGQGVAKELMEFAMQYSQQSGAKGLSLQTARDNYPAQKLYESLAWKRDEEFYTYHFTH